MENADDFRDALGVCVAFLCARLEELEDYVLVNQIHIPTDKLKALVGIGRDLAAACAAIEETASPQDLVVQFTDSES